MDVYLLLASETDPADLSLQSGNVLYNRYSQAASRYPEALMKNKVYRGAAAYVRHIFSELQ